MEQIPLLLFLLYALYEGLLHAFEADHVLAVTNIVSQRSAMVPALKDGVFWGLGHTSSIFVVGIILIVCRIGIPDGWFSCFEAGVGLMLILVASYRLYRFFKDGEAAVRVHPCGKGGLLHRTSYGIGAVHGLAGSGALVVLVMTQIETVWGSLLYLLIFGVGSILGMSFVAGLFGIPFSRKPVRSKWLRTVLIWLSSAACFLYGCLLVYDNLFAFRLASFSLW
jgi:hypothetical protein